MPPSKRPRPVARPVSRPRQPSAILASATRVKLRERNVQRKTEEWQKDAWRYYEEVGEIQHSIDFLANLASKIRLFGALVPTDPRIPPKIDPDSLADAAVAALRTKGSDYSAILKEVATNLYVAGECYLVGMGGSDTDSVESWDIKSTDELEITDNEYVLREYPTGPRESFGEGELLVIHIMLSHPRWGKMPISPMRGILASAEEVQRIERVIRGAARSRAAGPGLLLMPEEASFGSLDPTADSQGSGEALLDPFEQALMDAMITPIQDEGSASSVVPLIIRAPSDVLDKIRKVDLSVDINTELIKLERALTRLAQGLPLPPEIVTGKEGLSHWTAWSVDESTVTAYVEPFIVPIVDAFTVEYYRPFLSAADMPESETLTRMLWYDVTALITRPNRSADADFGLRSMALSDQAWRRVKGFTDEDAPDALQQLARLLLQRGSLDPLTTSALLQIVGIVPKGTPAINIQLPPTAGPPKPQQSEERGPPEKTRPKSDAPPSPNPLIYLPVHTVDGEQVGSQLAALDKELRIRLQTAADAAMSRTLERANAQVIRVFHKKTRYATLLRNTPKLEAAQRVGRINMEADGMQVSDLLTGTFDTLITRFRDWSIRTHNRAGRILGVTIPFDSEAIDAACSSLESDLITYATSRLFEPNASPVEPFGEMEPSAAVPHGIIRAALYRAGGGTDILPSDLSPPGGIATGKNILRAIGNLGGIVEGWEWSYASAMRTQEFEPHALLDGVRFSSFTDTVLGNKGTWPPVLQLYPGDHPSCQCEVRPILNLLNLTTAADTDGVSDAP